MNKPFSFTSHGGADPVSGIRPEVGVEVNRAQIKKIDEDTDKNIAKVTFRFDHLKHPVYAWTITDSEVYQIVKAAYESGDEVEYRIESQRKKEVPNDVPFEELKKEASTKLRRILVGVNNKYTTELLTDPTEDPVLGSTPAVSPEQASAGVPGASRTKGQGNSGGGFVLSPEDAVTRLELAAKDPNVRQNILDHLTAIAYISGASNDQIVKALTADDKRAEDTTPTSVAPAYSIEAPTWKQYNSDGRLNLGSLYVAAGVGVEAHVYKQLSTIDGALNAINLDEAITFFADAILTIADSIQKSSYEVTSGTPAARIDRSAGSHTRIRGVIFDTIERQASLPLQLTGNTLTLIGGEQGYKNWLVEVGRTSKERFLRAARVADRVKTFGQLVPPASLTGGKTTPQTAPARQTDTPEPTPAPEPEPEQIDALYGEEPPEDLPEIVVFEEPAEEPEKASTGKVNPKVAELQALANSVPNPENSELKITTKQERQILEAQLPDEPEENLDAQNEDGTVVLEEEYTLFPQLPVDPNDDRQLATTETIANLQRVFSNSGYNVDDPAEKVRIGKLIKYTFGVVQATKVPNEDLIGFIDYYESGGSQLLDHAIRTAVASVE